MSREPESSAADRLNPEKVAYWYFRLNGFFQMENFIVHPTGRGGQRTDADLLAVRFPHRAERLLDSPNGAMADDIRRLALSCDRIDVVIAEVKTNQPCTLNGPWTRQDCQNVHRVLAAIGCLARDHIDEAAADIYRTGVHVNNLGLRVRLAAIGSERSTQLSTDYPGVTQLTWPEVLAFIWDRFHRYHQQKTQVDQWDPQGRRLKHVADVSADADDFAVRVLPLMGVRHG